MTTDTYFGKQAIAYDSKRNKGFLGWLRKNEEKAILSFLDIRNHEDFLDAGCGEGHYAFLAKKAGAKPFGIDLSPEMITQLKAKNIPGKVCDLEHFSLGKKFDKIVCAGVLEFTENTQQVLKQLAHHLKPRGVLVLLYSRPSIGTFTYVLIHRFHGLSLKIIPRKRLQTLLNVAGLTITAHKHLPFFGGVARVEHKPS